MRLPGDFERELVSGHIDDVHGGLVGFPGNDVAVDAENEVAFSQTGVKRVAPLPDLK